MFRIQANNLQLFVKFNFSHTLSLLAFEEYLINTLEAANEHSDITTLHILIDYYAKQKMRGHGSYEMCADGRAVCNDILVKQLANRNKLVNLSFVEQLLVLGANANAVTPVNPKSALELAWAQNNISMVSLMLAYSGLPTRRLDDEFEKIFGLCRSKSFFSSEMPLKKAIRVLLTKPDSLEAKERSMLRRINIAELKAVSLTPFSKSPFMLKELLVGPILKLQKDQVPDDKALQASLNDTLPTFPVELTAIITTYCSGTSPLIGDDILAIFEETEAKRELDFKEEEPPSVPILKLDDSCCQRICKVLVEVLSQHRVPREKSKEHQDLCLLLGFIETKRAKLNANEIILIMGKLLSDYEDLASKLVKDVATAILTQYKTPPYFMHPMIGVLENPGKWFCSKQRTYKDAYGDFMPSYNQALQSRILLDLFKQAIPNFQDTVKLSLAQLLKILRQPIAITDKDPTEDEAGFSSSSSLISALQTSRTGTFSRVTTETTLSDSKRMDPVVTQQPPTNS